MESTGLLYLGTFLEGMLAFISPCILPMLPVYISYFAGGVTSEEEGSTWRTLKNALGFVLGFTLVYVAFGATAGLLGSFLIRYKTVTNLIFGGIVVLFGLHYMGVLQLGFLNRLTGRGMNHQQVQNLGFLSSTLFGIIFSVTTAASCLTTFAGAALMMAANHGTALKGITLLLFFSLGLGIPFILSALLLNQLKGVFDFLKRHYKVIHMVSGILLILIGIAMMTGLLDKALLLLS